MVSLATEKCGFSKTFPFFPELKDELGNHMAGEVRQRLVARDLEALSPSLQEAISAWQCDFSVNEISQS